MGYQLVLLTVLLARVVLCSASEISRPTGLVPHVICAAEQVIASSSSHPAAAGSQASQPERPWLVCSCELAYHIRTRVSA